MSESTTEERGVTVGELEATGREVMARSIPQSSIQRANLMFPKDDREAIAQFLTVDAEDPALLPYLAICAQWQLDPVAGQIWLIEQKVPAKNGQPERYVKRPAVGRDGFLAIARRQPEYLGMEHDVVHARDEFWVERDGDDHRIHHRYRAIPNEFEEGENHYTYRGPIVGAYAKVKMAGREPTYYFAPYDEHVQTGTDRNGRPYLRGAWRYKSGMILKSAQSMSLRLAVGVTGVVPVDEMRDPTDPSTALEASAVEVPRDPSDVVMEVAEVERYGDDLALELSQAVDAANAESPGSWGSAKLSMRLKGRGPDAGREVLAEIANESELRAARLAKAKARAAESPPEEAEAPVEVAEDAQLMVPVVDLEKGQVADAPGEGEESNWRTVKDVVNDRSAGVVVVFFEDGAELAFQPDVSLAVKG